MTLLHDIATARKALSQGPDEGFGGVKASYLDELLSRVERELAGASFGPGCSAEPEPAKVSDTEKAVVSRAYYVLHEDCTDYEPSPGWYLATKADPRGPFPTREEADAAIIGVPPNERLAEWVVVPASGIEAPAGRQDAEGGLTEGESPVAAGQTPTWSGWGLSTPPTEAPETPQQAHTSGGEA